MFAKRSKDKELMDLGQYTSEEYAQCLKILFIINKFLGIFHDTVSILKPFPKDASLVDVGCGGGLFLINLKAYYPQMHMVGLDVSEQAIQLAQDELHNSQHKNSIEFHLQKQAELALDQQSVDIVLVTLVCHHLDDEELIVFLQTAHKAARKAVIINDLHRHRLAYWLYGLVSPILFGNRLITHDGLLSIKKSFTRKELQSVLQQAQINNYKIKWRFPFRWSVLILTNNG
ncbi:MAG: methyltransferase domain-containing protein [Legionella sp.]|jgi:2-polyprenyl-3-methyl-5-hydroxy-6-metoxy-1,4-benzoquinol methylase